MFDFKTSLIFKLAYFFSSFLPSYIFIIIITYIQYIESSKRLFPSLVITSKKLVFIILVLLTFIASYSLYIILRKIKQEYETFRSNRAKQRGKLNKEYNSGIRDFLLSVLLPVITTIFIDEKPISGLVSIILIQSALMYFYFYSTDILPNIPLLFKGYYIVKGKVGDREMLFFVPREILLNALENEVYFAYLGGSDSNTVIAKIEE